MADQFDIAQDLEAYYRRQALEQHRHNTGCSGRKSLEHCIDCGDDIPQRRRELVPGCIRCIECQQLFEESQK